MGRDAEHIVERIRDVLAAFDWGEDDPQYALETIQYIVEEPVDWPEMPFIVRIPIVDLTEKS